MAREEILILICDRCGEREKDYHRKCLWGSVKIMGIKGSDETKPGRDFCPECYEKFLAFVGVK